MKRFIAGLLTLFMVTGMLISASPANETEAATTKIKRYTYYKELIGVLNGAETTEGKILTITFDGYSAEIEGAIGVEDGTVKSSATSSLAKKYNITKKNAKYLAAAQYLGLFDSEKYTSAKVNVSYKEAYIVLAKADRLINNVVDFNDEDIDYIIKNRISNIKKAGTTDEQRLLAESYARGFVKGTSDGEATSTRHIKMTTKVAASTAKKQMTMLTDKSQRYEMSPYWQLLRVNKKSYPKNARRFSYILEDFPNEYYENCMAEAYNSYYPNRALEEMSQYYPNAKLNAYWKDCNKTLGISTNWIDYYGTEGTLDEILYAHANPQYTELMYPESFGVDGTLDIASAALTGTSAVTFWPVDFKNACIKIAEMNQASDYDVYDVKFPAGNKYDELVNELISERITEAEEYIRDIFTVNYKTIENDTEWQERQKNDACIYPNADKYMQKFIENAKIRHTVIECKDIYTDVSSLGYFNGFPMITVHAKVKIKDDALKAYITGNYKDIRKGFIDVAKKIGLKDDVNYGTEGNYAVNEMCYCKSIMGSIVRAYPNYKQGEWIDLYVSVRVSTDKTENKIIRDYLVMPDVPVH